MGRNLRVDRRWLLVALPAIAATVMLLLHLRPLLVWRFTVRPEIIRAGKQAQIGAITEHDLPPPGDDWPRIHVRGMVVRAPLRPGQSEQCAACDRSCVLILEDGQLAILQGSLPERFDVAISLYAPSEEDLSILRSSAANWRTVEALASRGLLPTWTHEIFRYDGELTRGIVSRIEHEGIERFVIYPYRFDGGPGSVIAVSRTGPEAARRIASSVTFEDRVESGAWCEDAPAP